MASLDEINKIQGEHRRKLIDFWGIGSGARVFEIGCGQGDTTVALAQRVGDSGFVCGVDIALPEYGEPETLGQAKQRILTSPMGKRIEMYFDYNLLTKDITYATGDFDYGVFSHCLWYLTSYEELVALLKKARVFCKKLCIAEWNPLIHLPEQLPHFHAVNIQALCESFVTSDFANVRMMFYPADINNAVVESGWAVERNGNVYSSDMQDGVWEVNLVLDFYKERVASMEAMPEKLKKLLLSQIESLENVEIIKPLSAYCLIAT